MTRSLISNSTTNQSLQFNGIIPSSPDRPDSNSYLIHLQYFPNAFTWSYPTSPSPNLTSGILQSGPLTHRTFDPFTLLHTTLPSTLSLPSSDTTCIPFRPTRNPPASEACTSPFFAALHRALPYRFRLDGSGPHLAFITHFLGIVCVLYILRLEVTLRYRPGWMRCQCWWRWARRVCPLPKGTAEEVAALPGERWDAARLWIYGAMVGYGVLAVVWERMVAGFLVRTVGWVEEGLPGGKGVLEARVGERFWVVSWGGVGVAVVALVCVSVRACLMKGVEDGEGKGEPLLAKEGVVKAV